MSNSKIETELLAASGIELRKNEVRQTYLRRLTKAVYGVSDALWEALSDGAQDWYQAAATASSAGHDLPEFPDMPEPEPVKPVRVAPVKEANAEASNGAKHNGHNNGGSHKETKPVRRGRPPRAHQEPVDDEPLLRGRQSGPITKKASACHIIKKLVVKKPSISVADISSKLSDHGMKVTEVTVATLRSSTRDTLRVLNEEGMGSFKL